MQKWEYKATNGLLRLDINKVLRSWCEKGWTPHLITIYRDRGLHQATVALVTYFLIIFKRPIEK